MNSTALLRHLLNASHHTYRYKSIALNQQVTSFLDVKLKVVIN